MEGICTDEFRTHNGFIEYSNFLFWTHRYYSFHIVPHSFYEKLTLIHLRCLHVERQQISQNTDRYFYYVF